MYKRFSIIFCLKIKENKELLKQIRDEAITFAGERAKRIAQQKVEDAAQNKKIALKEQMKVVNEFDQFIMFVF